jgi:hypothetical protein
MIDEHQAWFLFVCILSVTKCVTRKCGTHKTKEEVRWINKTKPKTKQTSTKE